MTGAGSPVKWRAYFQSEARKGMITLTKGQTELIELMKSDPEYYISYDSVMARASLRYKDEKVKTIRFKMYLAIMPLLTPKKEQPFSTIKYLELKR
jgi:hypothetical protein